MPKLLNNISISPFCLQVVLHRQKNANLAKGRDIPEARSRNLWPNFIHVWLKEEDYQSQGGVDCLKMRISRLNYLDDDTR